MFKDYHYLARCIFELKDTLLGAKINSIFTQEKEKLFIDLSLTNEENNFLTLSTNSQLPHFIFRSSFSKAKKNTIEFFSDFLPAVINDVSISDHDRIIKFSSDQLDFYYLIRGGRSNFVAISNDEGIHSFKKILDPEQLNAELKSNNYINSANDFILDSELDLTNYVSLKKQAPYISKDLFNEVNLRLTKSGTPFDHYMNCIYEILTEPIKVGFNTNDELMFSPVSFQSIKIDEYNSFVNYNDAVLFYISNNYKNARLVSTRKSILQFVEREIAGLSNKLNSLKTRVENGSKDHIYYKFGNLLLANLAEIQNNSDKVILKDNDSEKDIEIKLDPKLLPQENANKYFNKAKDEKKNYSASKKLLDDTLNKYQTYINFREQISETNSTEELLKIKAELKIKDNTGGNKLESENISCYKYMLDGKYLVTVGRDSKSNDILTVKIAKQNDYWFHARGLPGSHVVLRVDNPKEAVPKHILNAAASIAAYYSKAKTAGIAPVAYTLKKFVRKNKNMNPGQVLLNKEKVLLVKPEIPKIAEHIDE